VDGTVTFIREGATTVLVVVQAAKGRRHRSVEKAFNGLIGALQFVLRVLCGGKFVRRLAKLFIEGCDKPIGRPRLLL
jgi:hypothetical protein